MTVRELIVALLDTPLDAEVEVDHPEWTEAVTGIRRIEHPGAGHGLAYVTLETQRLIALSNALATGWWDVWAQLMIFCGAAGYMSRSLFHVKPWGLWLDDGPWGRRRFWTCSGAQRWADECNQVRRVLGLEPMVTIYNRFEPSW